MKKNISTTKHKSNTEHEGSFTKSQFLESRLRTGLEKDLLSAVLVDGKSYKNEEVTSIIQNYMEKGVN